MTGPAQAEIMEAIEALPADRREELAAIIVSQEYHSGPIPPPASFAAYDIVLPGSAQAILDMAVRQQKHEIDMRERALASEINYRTLTLAAALIVTLAIIGGTVLLGLYGREKAASVLGTAGGVVLVAGALVKGRDLFPGREPLTRDDRGPKTQGRQKVPKRKT